MLDRRGGSLLLEHLGQELSALVPGQLQAASSVPFDGGALVRAATRHGVLDVDDHAERAAAHPRCGPAGGAVGG